MKYSLEKLATLLDARLEGDGTIEVDSIAPLDKAQASQASFIVGDKFKSQLVACQASVVLLKESLLEACPCAALVVADPYLGYAKLAQLLDSTPQAASGISADAMIHPSAQLSSGVSVAAGANIGAGVVIGENAQIGAGSVVGENTTIGAGTKIWANVTLYHGISVGKDCTIHSGTVIGADGFGFANDKGQWVKIPQLGSVVIGDRVDIGASTTIDRGALDNTVIGAGTIIDNQCQIAHNVEIGINCALAGAVTIAGSTKIGNYCVIGGASVINGHISICDQVQITGMAMIMRSIKTPGVYSSGIPAQPNKEWRKTAARTLKIDDMYRRLQQLEKQLDNQ